MQWALVSPSPSASQLQQAEQQQQVCSGAVAVQGQDGAPVQHDAQGAALVWQVCCCCHQTGMLPAAPSG